MITGARPQAPKQRPISSENSAVLGRAADVDAELLLERVHHGHAAAHVAGRAEADADEVLAARDRGEERVEAHHAGDFAVRLAEFTGDVLEGDLRQVPEDALGELQHRDQRARLALVLGDHCIEALEEFLLGGLLGAAGARLHCFSHSPLLRLSSAAIASQMMSLAHWCASWNVVSSPKRCGMSGPRRVVRAPSSVEVDPELDLRVGHDHGGDGGGDVAQRRAIDVAEPHPGAHGDPAELVGPAHAEPAAGGLGRLAEEAQAEAGLLVRLGREERVEGLLRFHRQARPVVLDADRELVGGRGRRRSSWRSPWRPRARSSRGCRGGRARGHASPTLRPSRPRTASASSPKAGRSQVTAVRAAPTSSR